MPNFKFLILIMSHNLGFIRVSVVHVKLNHDCFFIFVSIPVDNINKLSGLATKHWSYYHRNFATWDDLHVHLIFINYTLYFNLYFE
jgi:hypothetical protein